MIEIINPPYSFKDAQFKILFLAGSIDMGTAELWQEKVISKLTNCNIDLTILNPRRPDWDSSWKQDINNPKFKEQVEWELEGMEVADYIFFYFAPNSKAPITLLELGLNINPFAPKRHLFVICPNEFYRKGNVDIVCKTYHIPQYESINDAIKTLEGK